MHQFDEHHPEFRGFSAYYAAEILPDLKATEELRLLEMAGLKKKLPWVGLCVVLAIAMSLFLGWPLIAYIFIAFGTVISVGTLCFSALNGISTKTKGKIVGGVCAFLNWSFSEKVETPPKLRLVNTLGLVTGHYDRSHFEDRISGTAHGAKFVFYEAKLERKQRRKDGDHWTTVFRGQLLALEFNRTFIGQTVVLRDGGFFQSKKKGDMKHVGLVDPVFEEIFEAYGTDQVEARYLLTPTFMQRLVDLEHSVDGQNIRFGFTGGYLLIAVETENRYESGSMFSALTDTSRTQNILNEIGAIYNVIDGVMEPSAEA